MTIQPCPACNGNPNTNFCARCGTPGVWWKQRQRAEKAEGEVKAKTAMYERLLDQNNAQAATIAELRGRLERLRILWSDITSPELYGDGLETLLKEPAFVEFEALVLEGKASRPEARELPRVGDFVEVLRDSGGKWMCAKVTYWASGEAFDCQQSDGRVEARALSNEGKTWRRVVQGSVVSLEKAPTGVVPRQTDTSLVETVCRREDCDCRSQQVASTVNEMQGAQTHGVTKGTNG